VDSSGSEWDPVEGSCKHGDEPSGSIKGGGVSRTAKRLSASQGQVEVRQLVSY